MSQLLTMAGCDMADDPKKGGYVPVCDETGATSVPGIFVSGDVSGIEEASSAMIEGRIAGIAAAKYLGYVEQAAEESEVHALETSLDALRQGMFAPKNRGKDLRETEEGCPISQNLLRKGYLSDEEVFAYPGVRRSPASTRSSSARRISRAIPARTPARRAASRLAKTSRRCRS